MTIDAVSFEWARNKDGEAHRRISIPGDEKKKNRLIDLLYDGLERATNSKIVLQNEPVIPVSEPANRIGFLQTNEPEKKKRGRPRKN